MQCICVQDFYIEYGYLFGFTYTVEYTVQALRSFVVIFKKFKIVEMSFFLLCDYNKIM